MTVMIVLVLTALWNGHAGGSENPRSRSGATELLRAVADAYDENRSLFPFGSIDFDYVDGYASDLGAAKEGVLRDSYVAKGSYVYSGKDALFTRLFSVEAMAAAFAWSSNNHGTGRFTSARLLTDGAVTFTERIGPSKDGKSSLSGVVILPGVKPFYQHAEIPLSLGYPETARDDLASDFRMAVEGKHDVQVIEVEEDAVIDDGVRVVRVVIQHRLGRRTYWVDLQRGAIPVRIRSELAEGRSIEVSHGKIEQVERHGWIPLVTTTFLSNGRVKRVELRRFEFDESPRPTAFKVELDRARSVANAAAGRSYTPRKVVDLHHLPSPGSRESTPLETRKIAGRGDDMPGERQPRRFPYFTTTGLALSVLMWWSSGAGPGDPRRASRSRFAWDGRDSFGLPR